MLTLSTSPPNSLTLFLDRTHQSKVTAKLLRDLDISVEVHRRHYLPATPDPEWIADVSQRGWVIISGDKGIRLDGINRYAVAKAGAKVFVLSDTESRGAEWAASLVAARHKILRIASENSGPFFCVVEKAGDTHVKSPDFMEGGGPLPKSASMLESQVFVPESSVPIAGDDDPPNRQTKIEFSS